MSEIFKLVAKLTLDTSEFDKNTDESKEKASVFADVLKADLVGKGISLAVDGLPMTKRVLPSKETPFSS